MACSTWLATRGLQHVACTWWECVCGGWGFWMWRGAVLSKQGDAPRANGYGCYRCGTGLLTALHSRWTRCNTSPCALKSMYAARQSLIWKGQCATWVRNAWAFLLVVVVSSRVLRWPLPVRSPHLADAVDEIALVKNRERATIRAFSMFCTPPLLQSSI